jgi:8-oxo-dGTP diphosphatase
VALMHERHAHYCPQCGAPLAWQERFGRPRPVCTGCGRTLFFDPKVAVATLIVQNERVLLVQRANDPRKGWWALPAGFVEWDEDPKAAAARECLEETGLVVEVVQLIDVFHTPDDGGAADIVIAYRGRVISGTLTAADDAEAAAWFTRETLPPVAFLPTETVLARWIAQEMV